MMGILRIDQQQGGEGARHRLLRSSSSTEAVEAAEAAVAATAVRRPRTRLLPPSSREEEEEASLQRRRTTTTVSINPCEISNDAPEATDEGAENSAAKLAVCGTTHYLCQASASSRQRQQQEPLVIPFAYDVYYYNNQVNEQDDNDNYDASSIMDFVGESILNQGAAAMQLLSCATKSSVGGRNRRHHRQLLRPILEEEYSQQQQHRLLVQDEDAAAEDFTQIELERFMGLALEAKGQGIRSEGCSTTSATAPAVEGDDTTACLPVQSALTVYLQLSEQEATNGLKKIPDSERLAIQESIVSFLQTQMKNDVYIVPNSITKVAFVDASSTSTVKSDTPPVQEEVAIMDNRNPSSTATTTSASSEQTTTLIAAAACLLALVFFLVYFIWKRNRHNKKGRSTSSPLSSSAAVLKNPGDFSGEPPAGTPADTTTASSQPGTPATATCAMTALTCGEIQANHHKARRWGLANRDSLALVPQELEDVGVVNIESSNDNKNDENELYRRRTDSSSSEGVPPMSVVGAEYMVDHIDIDDGLSGFTLSTGARSEMGGDGGDGVIIYGGARALSMGGGDNRNGQPESPPPISTFSASMSDGFGTALSGIDHGDNNSTSTYSDEEEDYNEGASLSLIAEVRTSTMESQRHQNRYHTSSSSNDGDMQHNLEHEEVLSTTSYDTKKSAARRVLQMT